ncbi:GntR family transcriptional regulator [Pseudomonas sp. MH2]|uniref:GntR family transcriptional regulator n=1 Tax=Pseudomonas machongensis TaxID=3110229 RepID=A0ABU5VKP8_9PSED|nr:GntR family transcriptional regulator [Pseudomonas sp. MH2]MEA5673939.1 GntR family transcriptional regulator [Pseudomonas sp. MH2]
MSSKSPEKTGESLPLADQVALELREDIIGGRLVSGMPLVEAELTGRYNASRNTVREALHQLGHEGLTTYVRNKGVMVRRLGIAEVRDIFLVRRTLEVQAIHGSKPLREYQSDRMLDAIEAAELARDREDWQAFGTHSLRFHQHIVGLLRSPLLDAFFTNIAAQMRLVFAVAPDEKNFQSPWLERDREIHDLLADGLRHDAAEAMTRYLDDSEHALLDLFSHPPRS